MDDILTSEYRIKDITEIDLNVVFLHYTNVSNLKRIFENGLEPRIGSNSKGVEISKKIFFSIGDKGMLMLMDVWLKWLNTIPKNKLLFEIGSYFLKKSWFPKIIFKIIFSVWKKSKKRFIKTCKNLKNILDNSIFLILDLEEKIDFDFNDIDEVKIQKIPKEMVKNVYTT